MKNRSGTGILLESLFEAVATARCGEAGRSLCATGKSAQSAFREAHRPTSRSASMISDGSVSFGLTEPRDYCALRSRQIMANPIHPGEILLEEYLKPLGVSQNKLARSLRFTPKTISEIVLGKRGISPEMSIRLGKFFGQSPRFWLNLQTEYDFRCALRAEKRLTADVRVLKDLVAA